MIITNLVGSLAAICTTIAFVPQAYQSYKTRDLSGISLPMYSTFTLGVALWLVYGLLIQNWPIIVANAITLGLSSFVLVLKIMQINQKIK